MNDIVKSLLIVDDEQENLKSLRRIFVKEGFRVVTAERGKEALEQLRTDSFHVVLTDLKMPGEVDGMDILKTIKTLELDCQVVLMTAYGTIETAVQAIKSGAYDFVTKPFRKIDIVKTVERGYEKMALLEENRLLREKLQRIEHTEEIIWSSAAMQKPMLTLKQAAPSTATVLIQGESGTGKELFARAVHRLSDRNNKPFIAINCAALPESILESELFGYVKGAFTGAAADRDGRLMAANHGTLFLDEIGDMSLSLQAKLLRVLQEGEFERLGANHPTKVDFRLVAATNRNLREEVENRHFREDLYYRLNVINIQLPPFRDRKEDIPLLAQHFVQKYCEKNKKELKTLTPDAMEALLNHPWPGNVRELEKAVERAVVLSTGGALQPHDFFEEISKGTPPNEITVSFGMSLEEIEQKVIRETLQRTAGDKKLAAQILGIAVRTIYRKLD